MISLGGLYKKLRRNFLLGVNAAKLKSLKSDVSVGLVSCDTWKQRVYDDILLQKAFLDSGVKAEIVSWQDETIDFSKYNAMLITSMWGYQDYLPDLEKWLGKVEKMNVINSVDIVRDNYNKAKQIDILKKGGLPIVVTEILKKSDLLSAGTSFLKKHNISLPVVIKPSVSSGGANTFLVKNEREFERAAKMIQDSAADNVLVQPFVPEIESGEISVIIIGGKIVNAVTRFPGILSGDKQYRVTPLNIDDLAPDLIKLCDKVININEFRSCTYMRIDFVKKKADYLIMEVELFEPQLFYYMLKGKARKKMLSSMVQAVSACYN